MRFAPTPCLRVEPSCLVASQATTSCFAGGECHTKRQATRTSTAQASLRSAFGDVHPCERRRRTRTEGSPRRQLRALKLDTISAPEDSLRGEPARASEGGHLKQSFSGPPVASAQTTLRALKLDAISARRDSFAARLARASKLRSRLRALKPRIHDQTGSR